jgi:hypothetical protein
MISLLFLKLRDDSFFFIMGNLELLLFFLEPFGLILHLGNLS